MEHERLALVVEGAPNSGKTTTLHAFVKQYSESGPRPKAGWKPLWLNPRFNALQVWFYRIYSSASECNRSLEERLPQVDWLPGCIMIALQPDGDRAAETIQFLQENNFRIERFPLSNMEGNNLWDRFNENNRAERLQARAEEMMRRTCNFIRDYNLI